MKTIQGPGIFLAQFVRDSEPFNSIEGLGRWVSGFGYKGVQIPTWESSLIDLEKAASSKAYCDEYKGRLAEMGLEIIELGSYLQGQVLAFHPAYAPGFEAFHPKGLKGAEVTEWATDQLKKTVDASVNFGTSNISAMSGGFAWLSAGWAIGCQTWRALFSFRKFMSFMSGPRAVHMRGWGQRAATWLGVRQAGLRPGRVSPR